MSDFLPHSKKTVSELANTWAYEKLKTIEELTGLAVFASGGEMCWKESAAHLKSLPDINAQGLCMLLCANFCVVPPRWIINREVSTGQTNAAGRMIIAKKNEAETEAKLVEMAKLLPMHDNTKKWESISSDEKIAFKQALGSRADWGELQLVNLSSVYRIGFSFLDHLIKHGKEQHPLVLRLRLNLVSGSIQNPGYRDGTDKTIQIFRETIGKLRSQLKYSLTHLKPLIKSVTTDWNKTSTAKVAPTVSGVAKVRPAK